MLSVAASLALHLSMSTLGVALLWQFASAGPTRAVRLRRAPGYGCQLARPRPDHAVISPPDGNLERHETQDFDRPYAVRVHQDTDDDG